MMMPSIFRENLFDDDWMNFPFERQFFGKHDPSYEKSQKNLMRTDVKELESSYEIDVELPGFKKDDLKLELKEGYLTIQAVKDVKKDTKNEEGKFIRRERYSGSCSRSFYIGKGVKQEDVHAKFEDGILKLAVPKAVQPKTEESKYISIEG